MKLDTFGADLVNTERLFTLTPPALLEFSRRKVAQRGVDALVHVDVVQELGKMEPGIIIVFIVRQVNFFLFDGADEPLSVAVLPDLTALGHTDCSTNSQQHVDVGRSCILDTLVRVVDLWIVLGQRPVL